MKWGVRGVVLAALVGCGFLPYAHDVGGEFRMIPGAEYGVRAQTTGEISEIKVQPGDAVTKEQLVAQINPREQKANVEMTTAALAEAQAKLDLLLAGARKESIEAAQQRVELDRHRLEYYSREFTRFEELAKSESVTEAELANAQFNRDTSQREFNASREELKALESGAREEEIKAARAEVARLDAQLARQQLELSLTEIHSPLNGRVVTSNVQMRRGLYVTPGDLIAVVVDTDKMRAEISATEAAAAYVRPGQTVHLRFEGLDGELVLGRVTEVAAVAVTEEEAKANRVRSDREQLLDSWGRQGDERYVTVYASLEAPRADLVPEMTGYARINIGPDVLWRALLRPILRFIRIDVWSWLP